MLCKGFPGSGCYTTQHGHVSRAHVLNNQHWASGRILRSHSLSTSAPNGADMEECDVVVIGSGIAGLSSAALLSTYGLNVVVCESHSVIGGATHSFTRQGYHFESGPSLYSGLKSRGPQANPLGLVLQAVGANVDIVTYDVWNVYLPELEWKKFPAKVGPDGFDELFKACGDDETLKQWDRLIHFTKPLSKASTSVPPLAIRLDTGVIWTTLFRYFGSIVNSLPTLGILTKPYSHVLKMANITDSFLLNYLDLLCWLLSGLPADGTITAEVAFMLEEWTNVDAKLEFPIGGSQRLADALAECVTQRGGTVYVGQHVENILVENGTAVGVRTKKNKVIRARKGVISNASTIDTVKLLPDSMDPLKKSWSEDVEKIPLNPSFMHLHVGFDASGLDDLDMHHLVVDDWSKGVTAEQNIVLISIASVADASLSPEGTHCLHAYYPATEPFEYWENLTKEKYNDLKELRSQNLWKAVEKVIPDIRKRAEISMVGTPLTHASYLRRYKGSYGAAYKAGEQVFPFGSTPVKSLLACGDFVFPGIGLPAAAASGSIAANSLVPLEKHKELLDSIGL
jgi:phytoene dehydrogenase-like protein